MGHGPCKGCATGDGPVVKDFGVKSKTCFSYNLTFPHHVEADIYASSFEDFESWLCFLDEAASRVSGISAATTLTKVTTLTVNFLIFSSNSVIAFDSFSAFDCLTNKESVFLRLAHSSFVPLSIFCCS